MKIYNEEAECPACRSKGKFIRIRNKKLGALLFQCVAGDCHVITFLVWIHSNFQEIIRK